MISFIWMRRATRKIDIKISSGKQVKFYRYRIFYIYIIDKREESIFFFFNIRINVFKLENWNGLIGSRVRRKNKLEFFVSKKQLFHIHWLEKEKIKKKKKKMALICNPFYQLRSKILSHSFLIINCRNIQRKINSRPSSLHISYILRLNLSFFPFFFCFFRFFRNLAQPRKVVLALPEDDWDQDNKQRVKTFIIKIN